MIIGDYKNWQGEQKFPTKSPFTIRGYDFEFNKWGKDPENLPSEDKLLFNLWMVEPSPEHPAIMGKVEVYTLGGSDVMKYVYVNPYFLDDENELGSITLELKKASGEQLLNHP